MTDALNEPAQPGATEFWESRYAERPQVWSGKVNAILAAEAGSLQPGTALDLGCGEGGDAIWLGEHGWTVTAVDISATALQRLDERAASVGIGDRITTERHDLDATFPSGTFDLVSAQYLHSPVELARHEILRRAAHAVAPGGTLLVVSHAAFPPWAQHHDPNVSFDSAEETLERLDLDDSRWSVVRCDSIERDAEGPDGQRGTLLDTIVVARRS